MPITLASEQEAQGPRQAGRPCCLAVGGLIILDVAQVGPIAEAGPQ